MLVAVEPSAGIVTVSGSMIDAVADETLIQRLRDAGYGVEQHEDVDEAARESLREVGQGNRYRDRRQ